MREHRKETRRDTVRSLADVAEASPRDTPAHGVDATMLAEERRLAEKAERTSIGRAERMANEAGASLRALNAQIAEQAKEQADQRIKVGMLIHQYDEVSASMTSAAHAEIDTARRLTTIEGDIAAIKGDMLLVKGLLEAVLARLPLKREES